uniref:Uncharacterized protein n=1 Tax=Coccidioides posadasii RMSCC 3488 TaxID=454284 RepID=A0A0J6FA17_COCPO|nr:hypothetical protein CPAG_03395 [Coccidioides posadasii RMSCC 3488]
MKEESMMSTIPRGPPVILYSSGTSSMAKVPLQFNPAWKGTHERIRGHAPGSRPFTRGEVCLSKYPTAGSFKKEALLTAEVAEIGRKDSELSHFARCWNP